MHSGKLVPKKCKISKPLLLFLFIIGFSINLPAQETREDCLALLDSGLYYSNQNQYAKSIKIFSKAELLAKENDWPGILWFVYNQYGLYYTALSSFGEALGYYQKALNILEKDPFSDKAKTTTNQIVVLNNIGIMYSDKGEASKGIPYLLKAEELSEHIKTPSSLQKKLGINIADLYNSQGDHDKALKKLMAVKHLDADTIVMTGWEITFAETLYHTGKLDQAKQLAEELFEYTKKEKTGVCNICILDLLSKIYKEQMQLDKAITYTKMALEYDNELGLKIKRYSSLADLYQQKGKFDIALQYKDSVISTKDSFSERMNRQLFESNKVKFQVQEYQNELKLKQKSHDAQIKIFVIIIILGSISFILIYAWQKNRIVKQRQKREISEKKNTIIELELENEKNEKLLLETKMSELKVKAKLRQEQLKEKIARKNRELSATTLYHSSRNELLEEIISSLSEKSAAQKNTEIREYIKKLKEHLKPEKEWKDFLIHFEDVNPGFLKILKEKHPQLTKKDIRFICFLYINLGTKEICTILNITPASFWKRKQRLSEKMGLKKGELYNYILNLLVSKT